MHPDVGQAAAHTPDPSNTRPPARKPESNPQNGETRKRLESAATPGPSTEPLPVSHPSPTGPTLRANPFPEVTDLTCRLPLPTLIYRLEAVHLGDQMRIWVRTGVKVRILAPGFSSSILEERGRRKNRGALRDQDPLSERPGSQGPRSLNQKRQLFPALQLDISRKANALRLGSTRGTTTPHVQVPE
jgi:hypothetical protein